MANVFVTGSTGYLGVPLVSTLLDHGHAVTSLVRPGKSAQGDIVEGNALRAATFAKHVQPSHVYVHLVGTPKPAPWKAKQFQEVDQVALEASLEAALAAKVKQFVYLSVAHPAPVMRAYIAVRMECEALLRRSGMNVTFVRPWYVLGPNHWWPYALKPFYAAASAIPAFSEAAKRLGLVTRSEITSALVRAVEQPAQGVRIVDVEAIRSANF